MHTKYIFNHNNSIWLRAVLSTQVIQRGVVALV